MYTNLGACVEVIRRDRPGSQTGKKFFNENAVQIRKVGENTLTLANSGVCGINLPLLFHRCHLHYSEETDL